MNDLVNQFAKQPLAVKVVVLLVLVGLILGGNYQVFHVPKQKELKNLQKKADDRQAKLVENQAVAANLPKFQREVNALNEELKQAVALLPNEADIENIYRQLSITAKKSNIDLLLFKPGGQRSKGFYSEIGMTLKISGGFHDIATYIAEVGKLARIINVYDLNFSGPKMGANNQIMLTVDCKANTFMFRGGA